MTDEEVERLMKRCQRGVGGRGALDEAHSIMAECYGALGRLMLDRQQLRESLAELVDGLDCTVWSSWQTTARFDPALTAARQLLEGE